MFWFFNVFERKRKKGYLKKNVREKMPLKIIEYNLNTLLNLIRKVIRQIYLRRIPRKKPFGIVRYFYTFFCNDTFTKLEPKFADRDRFKK